MTADIDLKFDLSQYNYNFANRVLLKRKYSWALRNAELLSIIAISVIYIAGSVANKAGHNVPPLLGLLAILLICFWLTYVISRRRRQLWVSAAQSPLRWGPNTLSTDDTGFTRENSSGHVFVKWSHVTDIVDARDGLLIFCGEIDYFPIPEAAFSDNSDKDLFSRRVKDHIAANRGIET